MRFDLVTEPWLCLRRVRLVWEAMGKSGCLASLFCGFKPEGEVAFWLWGYQEVPTVGQTQTLLSMDLKKLGSKTLKKAKS